MSSSSLWSAVKRVVVVDPVLRTRLLTCRVVRRLGHMPLAFNSTADLRAHGPFDRPVDMALIAIRSEVTVEMASLNDVRAVVGHGAALGLQIPGRDLFWASRLIKPGARDELSPHLRQLSEVFAFVERLMVRNGFTLSSLEPEWGPFRFALATGEVWISGKPVKLKPLEFDLAIGFFQNREHLLSRDWLYAMYWAPRRDQYTSRSLDVHVSRVRYALNLQARSDWVLHGVSGHGYVLRGPLVSTTPTSDHVRAITNNHIFALI